MEGCPGLGAQLVHPRTAERAESLQVQVDICGSGNSRQVLADRSWSEKSSQTQGHLEKRDHGQNSTRSESSENFLGPSISVVPASQELLLKHSAVKHQDVCS